jgi:hypothetical protein
MRKHELPAVLALVFTMAAPESIAADAQQPAQAAPGAAPVQQPHNPYAAGYLNPLDPFTWLNFIARASQALTVSLQGTQPGYASPPYYNPFQFPPAPGTPLPPAGAAPTPTTGTPGSPYYFNPFDPNLLLYMLNQGVSSLYYPYGVPTQPGTAQPSSQPAPKK